MKLKSTLFPVSCSVVLLAACSKFNLDKVTYKVTPDPLEYKNDSVAFKVSGEYPKKAIPKNGRATLTPVFEFNGQTVEGKPLLVKGVKNKGEGIVLDKTGGSFSHSGVVQYAAGMEHAEMHVKAVGFIKDKTTEKFNAKTEKPIDWGVSITPLLVVKETAGSVGKHNYGPVNVTHNASVYFAYNSKTVRPSELNSDDIKAFREFVKLHSGNGSTFKKTDVVGWASPEGSDEYNQKLSGERATQTKSVVQKELKKLNKVLAENSEFVSSEGKGRDVAGFEARVKEKNGNSQVAQIVKTGVSRNELQKQLKSIGGESISAVEADLLAPLRRAEILTTVTLREKTAEEIKTKAVNTPDSLTLEEKLYAAQNLITDENQRLAIYQNAQKSNPEDWRAYNNAGVAYAAMDKWNEAEIEFRKAEKIAPNEKIVLANLGKYFYQKGETAKAEEYFKKAAGNEDADHALGSLYILQGKYSEAVSLYGSTKSFNAALAKCLAGNPGEVAPTIDGSDDQEKALSYYLKAIASARLTNKASVLSNLKEAFTRDNSLKAKAAKDVEFQKYFEDSDFKSAVN